MTPFSLIVPGRKVRNSKTELVSPVLYTFAVTSSNVRPDSESILAQKLSVSFPLAFLLPFFILITGFFLSSGR